MEKTSELLKRGLATLATIAVPGDKLSPSEVFSLYRAAGGEIHTLPELEAAAAMPTPPVWYVNLRDQLSRGFRFVAGVWRIPTAEDVRQVADQITTHSRILSDLSSTHSDFCARLKRSDAVTRSAELATLIAEAEGQERIAESLAAGERHDQRRLQENAEIVVMI